MKIFMTFGAFAGLALAGSAGAAEYSHYLKVNVPFSFVVAGQQFAAGQYDIKETENGIITVQGQGKAAAVISTPSQIAKPGETSRLSFTSDESREYLSGVSVEGEVSRAVPVPNTTERKLTFASH
jgi:hypothetical protein